MPVLITPPADAEIIHFMSCPISYCTYNIHVSKCLDIIVISFWYVIESLSSGSTYIIFFHGGVMIKKSGYSRQWEVYTVR